MNLASFYLVGIPLAMLLTFYFDFGLAGLWTGIGGAFFSQAATLACLVAFANYDKVAEAVAALAAAAEDPEYTQWIEDEGLEAPLIHTTTRSISISGMRSHHHSITGMSPGTLSSPGRARTLAASLGTSFTMTHSPWS